MFSKTIRSIFVIAVSLLIANSDAIAAENEIVTLKLAGSMAVEAPVSKKWTDWPKSAQKNLEDVYR